VIGEEPEATSYSQEQALNQTNDIKRHTRHIREFPKITVYFQAIGYPTIQRDDYMLLHCILQTIAKIKNLK
jgi:hypothetical protein